MEFENQEKQEENSVMDIPRKGNAFLSVIKNLLIFSALIAVVVGSFWFSFNLGRRLFMPVKKGADKKIEAAIPEPPSAIASLQEQKTEEYEELVPTAEMDETVKVVVEELRETAAPAPKPKVKPAAAKPRVTSPTAGSAYYKVQAGVFAEQSNARALASRLQSKGFETYIKKVDAGWRVQAGAFDREAWAKDLQKSLETKGFESTIIHE